MAELLNFLDNEDLRLGTLQDLKLLDTPPSEAFDRLTRLACKLFQTPVSLISLTDKDRQWFKSKVGIEHCEIPRELSPCSAAIRGQDVFVVRDLLEDRRFCTAPLAQSGVRYYAGAPLFTRSGHCLGTICILDMIPREHSAGELAVLKDLAGMVMAQIELQAMIGQVDPTTGAPNQHRFLADLEDLQRAGAGPMHGLVIEMMSCERMADLSHTLGPAVADDVMRAARTLINENVGARATVYHVGPTRFAVLCDAAGPEIEVVTQRLDTALAGRLSCGGVPIALDPAMGRHGFWPRQDAPQDVLRRLMITTTEARHQGGHAAYSSAHEVRAARRFALINDFAAALDDDRQLSLMFQPRVDLKSGRWVGAEALLRWQHPVLGLVAPGEFIPLIEKTALARPMMDWVARSALTTKAVWHARGIDLRMSINASALNLDEADFAERLLAIIDQTQVDPRSVEIEFTESAMAREPARVVVQMDKLRSHGVTLAIDDFGTGYSNLSYVQQLPVSTLKIDQLFIRKLDRSERARKLVRAMLGIAQDLDYSVVAEGIETQQSLDLLRDWNCDEGQGFLLAKPMHPQEIMRQYPGRIGAAA